MESKNDIEPIYNSYIDDLYAYAIHLGFDREEDMYIDVGLYDPMTDNTVNWLRENLQLGDSVEIIIKQIDETKVSIPLDKYDFLKRIGITKEEADRKTLQRFLLLKKDLEAEGLI